MKRLIFLNRYAHPDHSATSQILSDLAFELAGDGRDVHIVTSRQRYDDSKAALPPAETVQGVTLHRVATTQFGRAALPGRAIDYGSFYLSMRRAIRNLAKPGDTLIAMTDPPLISIVAAWAAKRQNLRLVNWLQDIYPEIAVELGVPMIGWASGPIAALRDKSLHTAAINVVVGQTMAERLQATGIAPARIEVIPNWCDDEAIVPLARDDNPLRREWRLQDKYVVGYSGNIGRAHEFRTILDASERLKEDPRIVFLFIGGGHRLGELMREVKTRNLQHLYRFQPYQDRAALKHSLNVPDAHWISLRPELEGLIVPSKFLAAAAAGRPIVAITANDGEIARLVRLHDCGLVCPPGDADTLVSQLLQLCNDETRTSALGARARAMLDANFTRRRAIERWKAVLEAD